MTQEAAFPTAKTSARIRPNRRRRAAQISLLLLACLLILLCYMGVFGGNVHVVQEGRVYRSAQLTGVGLQSESARLAGHGLPDVLDKYHIRTVINLRGASNDANWYFAEKSICEHRGVTHIDIPFSAVKMPPPDSLNKLLAAWDRAAYPILYHCQAGADRTGMASVLYAAIYEHKPLDTAENSQLTWRYGHIKWSRTGRMDEFFDLYRTTSNGMGLREWITTRYPALYDAMPADIKGNGPDMLGRTPAQQP